MADKAFIGRYRYQYRYRSVHYLPQLIFKGSLKSESKKIKELLELLDLGMNGSSDLIAHTVASLYFHWVDKAMACSGHIFLSGISTTFQYAIWLCDKTILSSTTM